MTTRMQDVDWEIKKREALERLKLLQNFKSQLERGEMPDQDTLIAAINRAEVGLDQLKAQSISEGREVLDSTQALLDALKALIREKQGLALTGLQFAKESALAVQEAMEGLKQLAVSSKEPLQGDLQAAAQQQQRMLDEAREKVRSVAERVLAVLRALASSAEGRSLAAHVSKLLRLWVDIVGRGVEAGATAIGQRLQQEATAEATEGAEAVEAEEEEEGEAEGEAEAEEAHPSMEGLPEAEKRKLKRKAKRQRQKARHQADKDKEQQAPQQPKAAPQQRQPGQGEVSLSEQLAGKAEEAQAKAERVAREATQAVDKATTKQREEAGREAETVQELSRRILRTAVSDPQLKSAVRDLLFIIKDYARRIGETLEQGAERAESVLTAEAQKPAVQEKKEEALSHAEKAAQLATKMVEQLTPAAYLQPVKDDAHRVFEMVRGDERVSSYMKSLSAVVEEVLARPDLLDSAEFNKRIDELLSEGREVLGGKGAALRVELEKLGQSVERVAEALSNDEHLRDLQASINRLSSALLQADAQGRMTLNPTAVAEIKRVFAPLIADALRMMPLPTLVHQDPNYFIQLSDLVIFAPAIPIDDIHVHMESDMILDLSEMQAKRAHSHIDITIHNLDLMAKNAKFHLHRYSFPRLTDTGHVDVMARNVMLRLVLRQQENAPFINKVSAIVDVEDFGVKIHDDADHQVLLQFITGWYKRSIGSALAEGLAKALENLGATFADAINKVLEVLTAKGPLFSVESQPQQHSLPGSDAGAAVERTYV